MNKNQCSRLQRVPFTRCSRAKPKGVFVPKALAFAVASRFAADLALANPTGMSVVNGQVTANQVGKTLTLANTPGAIINWQAFSIGANEITRFIQQSAASSVLNRVKGVDPSLILGSLQSQLANGTTAGRVFLLNPNGIVFGAGAKIDVGGLVASTLNLSDSDFLANRLRFTEVPGAGGITNQGVISTPNGGQVYLIAPNVHNTGLITSPQGQVILAAGRSVELVDSVTPNLRVEISAPDTEAVNVGQIIANSGKIGIYSGWIKNSGVIRADGVVKGANGEILLKATKNVALKSGGVVSASGAANGVGGGTISAEANSISNAGLVKVNAADNASAGSISMVAQDRMTLADTSRVEAKGADFGSQGGNVYFYSFGNALAQNGQMIDFSGGTMSGDAGSGEFSAAGHVTFGGTLVGSAAPGYKMGNFLIDPFTVTFTGGAIGANTVIQSGDNINITGGATIGSNVTLALLADHRSSVPGQWDDGRDYGPPFGTGTVGVGGITDPGGFTITGTDSTSQLVMFAAGGGIGSAVAPIRTNMNGGSVAAFTNNPDQVGTADTFITNGASVINIARLDDGVKSNTFSITSLEDITQGAVTNIFPGLVTDGLITASALAADSTRGKVLMGDLDNLVDTVAGHSDDGGFDGRFLFRNAKPLTIGTVAGLVGISADGDLSAAINVTTTSGNITVASPVSAISSEGNASVILNGALGLTVNAAVSADGNERGTVTLTASNGNLTINGPVSAIGQFDDGKVLLFANGIGPLIINSPVSAESEFGNSFNGSTSATSIAVNAALSAISTDAESGEAFVSVFADTAITVSDTVSATSKGFIASVALRSGGSMLVNGAVSTNGNNSATTNLRSESGGLTTNAVISSNANVNLIANGGGALTTNDTVRAAGRDALVNLTTTGGGAITINGTIIADGLNTAIVSVTTIGGGAINVLDNIEVFTISDAATINLSASGGGSINVNSNLTISPEAGDAFLNATATDGGSINVNSFINIFGEPEAIVTLTTNGGGSINVNNIVNVNATSNAQVNMSAISGGSITLAADVNATASGIANISLAAPGGAITRSAGHLVAIGSPAAVSLIAANGIGNFGNAIRIAGADPDILAHNTSRGNIVLSQDFGLMNADEVVNNAPGGAVDLTVAISGELLTGNGGAPVSSQGPLTLRATVPNGRVNIVDVGVHAAGEVTLIADNIDTAGTVGVSDGVISDAGVINVRTFIAARPIVLGSDGDGTQLGLSSLDIVKLNRGNGVVVGDSAARNNSIRFVAPTTIAGTMTLFGSSVAQNTGAGIAGGLVVGVGAGDIALVEPTNAINRFATVGAVTGNVAVSTTSNIALGPVTATGFVDVFSLGAITDGNPSGADVIASAVTLNAGSGIGTVADPLETQVSSPLTLGSAGGDIGVINVGNVDLRVLLTGGGNIAFTNFGNVVLNLLDFSGASAVLESTGTMSTNANIHVSATGGLALMGDTGLNVNHSVEVDIGDLILSGGSGNLNVVAPSGGAAIAGRNVSLFANNIDVRGVDAAASAATTIRAIDGIELSGAAGLAVNNSVIIAGGDSLLSGGSGNLVITAPPGGATIEGRNVSLFANNIDVRGVDAAASAATTIRAIDGIELSGAAGLAVNNSVIIAGGDLLLSGGSGNLVITAPPGGATIEGRNVSLFANNIDVRGVDAAASAATTIRAIDGIELSGAAGLAVNNSVIIAGGNLLLSGGSGNLVITAPPGGATIEGRNVSLFANNIDVRGVDSGADGATRIHATGEMSLVALNEIKMRGGAVGSSPVEVHNDSGPFTIFTGGDVNLKGGTGANSHVLWFGNPDVDMAACISPGLCGIGGVINLVTGGPGSFAKIEAASAATVSALLCSCASGCFFVDGVEGVVFNSATGSGFVAGGAPAPSGSFSFGIPTPPAPEEGLSAEDNQTIAQALSFTAGEVNSATQPLDKEDQQQEEKLGEQTPPMMCTP